ncbi:hypothetical protein PTKIN_Ptkin14bG0016100 [Pterospermum kingtungense]
MELQFPSVTLFLTFLFLFMVVRRLKKTTANNSTVKLLPGPWKLPFVGNMHQLISSLPHHSITDLAKKYGPLMLLQLGEVPTVVVSSAKVAEEVMNTNDIIFAQRPYVPSMDIMSYDYKDIIFTPYGNYWRQMRKICRIELLSPTCVQSFQSIREKEVSDIIKYIAFNEGASINLSEKIFSLSYGTTARAAFGMKDKGQEEFIKVMSKAFQLAGGFRLADMYPSSELLRWISGMRAEVEKLHQASDRILENIVNEHKESRKRMKEEGDELVEENLVDALLKLQEQGDLEFPLENDNIKAIIMDMFRDVKRANPIGFGLVLMGFGLNGSG